MPRSLPRGSSRRSLRGGTAPEPASTFRVQLRNRPIEAPRADVLSHEVAAVCGTTEPTVATWVAAGHLVPLSVGPLTFDAEAIAAYVVDNVRHRALALWALEQIVLGDLAAPDRPDGDTSLTWALEAFLRAVRAR